MKFPAEETRLEFYEARFLNQLMAVSVVVNSCARNSMDLEFDEARFPNQLIAVSVVVNSGARR